MTDHSTPASVPGSELPAIPDTPTVIPPPPVPESKPGFLKRLFTSRRKTQAMAVQNGYLEMVDLIRAIRSHLDRQETVQTTVLALLEKVPSAMDRQNDVMGLFKQQLENNLAKDQQLTDSMSHLNQTLSAMDESQRASSHTITDLIHRSRESEQLLREVMRRAERRMTILLVFFFLLAVVGAIYFVRWQRAASVAPVAPAAAVVATEATPPAAEPAAAESVEPEAPAPAVAAEPAAPEVEQPPAAAIEEPAPALPEPKKAATSKKPSKKKKSAPRAKTEEAPKASANQEPVVDEQPAPASEPAPALETAPAATEPAPAIELAPAVEPPPAELSLTSQVIGVPLAEPDATTPTAP